ncbi:MAG: hypothetical protein HYU67_04250 [Flavobacteriia bacterium]|nr:hypothetical protein [Flavobacteriia bacterium]
MGNYLKFISLILFISTSWNIFTQENEESEQNDNPLNESHEIGLDGVVKASTIGGSYGFGLKYGFVKNQNLTFGPALRFQRIWSNLNGNKTYFNIYGGGAFVHYRYKNIVYAAVELEFLKSPLHFNIVNSSTNWIATCFVGGGISREFSIGIRINAGLYYDVINNSNSPMQFAYISRNAQGKPQPIIYRVGFHFLI